jgi:hypothetical protein
MAQSVQRVCCMVQLAMVTIEETLNFIMTSFLFHMTCHMLPSR